MRDLSSAGPDRILYECCDLSPSENLQVYGPHSSLPYNSSDNVTDHGVKGRHMGMVIHYREKKTGPPSLGSDP
jgi:hypothetical protein